MCRQLCRQLWNFNPRSPRGERLAVIDYFLSFLSNFNPRSPRGERLWTNQGWDELDKFQSTLPARGATNKICNYLRHFTISIHAPREGSDCGVIGGRDRDSLISIHAPREGSDNFVAMIGNIFDNFNPRSPRGERPRSQNPQEGVKNFNPRSPRGERQMRLCRFVSYFDFNPRSPRGERQTSAICP